jgi:hypothetical protein
MRPTPFVVVRRMNTKYGMGVVPALCEGEHANVVEVFLPKRYGDLIEDSDMEAINTKPKQYYLTTRGTCGRRSNVDFVHYMWQNRDMAVFQRHVLTFLPISPFTHRRLLCIRYYKVASTAWSFTSGCVTCADNFRERLRHNTGCVAPDEACVCNIFRRQPPTLRDMALLTLCIMSINMPRFEVTRYVTYGQYVGALTSGRATGTGLLPPEFPYISTSYQYANHYTRLYHPHCRPDLL